MIEMAQFYKVTTSTDPLRLRSTADTSSEENIIARIPKGAIVSETGIGVMASVDGWKYVTYNGASGYASSQYLTPCDESGNVTGEPDKTKPVHDEGTNGGGNGGNTSNSGKKWMIAGGIALAVGAVMNIFL